MASHIECHKLCYTPEQLFKLVAQVERYPEFLPLWHSVNVSKEQYNELGQRIYLTEQVIHLGPLYKSFCTQTTLEPFHRIHIDSSDPMFRKFSIDWLFTSGTESNGKEAGCQIDFKLNCEASSMLLRPIFDIALMDTARSIVSAFENRARCIYDH
ncbi:MAG: type II toxin-antitoxin system RatA family toxin [Gammaproteobacteria bacterium]|nr:type II toxin-antitoxin system RatA family toxin [Gammaproteobacteria bacterium]